MKNILWKLPVPTTGIIRGPAFSVLPRRECEIALSFEGSDGDEKWQRLRFKDVEAFKCTFLSALDSIDQDLCRDAYGTLISVERSSWLAETEKSHRAYCRLAGQQPKVLQLLMICFDDGPCYEIICNQFHIE